MPDNVNSEASSNEALHRKRQVDPEAIKNLLAVLRQAKVTDFLAQRVYFGLQRLIFFDLARKKPTGNGCLFGDALRRQNVSIAPLVLSGREIAQLEETFFNQCVQHVVRATDTDACGRSQLSL